MVQTDFYICGLAPFNTTNNSSSNNNNCPTDNQFLILCYEKSEVSNRLFPANKTPFTPFF